MNQSKSVKIIVGALILALLAFIGFKYLKTQNTQSGSSDVLETSRVTETIIGRDIINELTILNSIHLDDAIFKSDIFLSLNDFTLTVVPEAQGRSNPFAPIGSDSGARATSTGASR